MYRILLPVDSNEESALMTAKTVENLPGQVDELAVTILNIHEPVEVSSSEGGQISSEEWYDETDFPKSVKEVAAYLEELGTPVEMRREHAEPAETIIKVANEVEADQIVMTGRKHSPVGKVLFGSVTQSVLLNADVPVNVVPA